MEKVPEPEARDLLPAKVQTLQQALKTKKTNQFRDQAIFAGLAHGLRASEVCDLNVGDFDGVRVHIRKAKDDSTGTVPLMQEGREQLSRYLESQRSREGS
ncbi:site-specific integrase [Leptolyngbya sp. FACHB-261]|uniref:site-specific integrase n=1 Tax=Leptolyngbya sp. FACHB-261 TaxID=2692806 RepID=UPI0016845F9D|nr:site-specific integrase [Leptolyngbya sp. FACHB-261]MBD2100969.1 site-specific integrase [Leptolyngbya sp. FACHB-261]